MFDLKSWMGERGVAQRELGRQVEQAWRQSAPSRDLPKATSIATKLGLLLKGDTGWWESQPDALAALALVVGCKAEDLLEARQPEGVPIAAFPGLRPLLGGEDPCQLRDDGSWIGSRALVLLYARPRTWLVAPQGAGKSLTIDVLRERYGSRITAVGFRSLVDAVELRSARPIVVEVEESDPATDERACTALQRASAHLCVLAPFRPPVTAGWAVETWAPQGGWRKRLLAWAHARAPDPSKLELESVEEFLEEVDPDGVLFSTPEDVLSLARHASLLGLPTTPKSSASPLASLARAYLAAGPFAAQAAWARDHGPTLFERLASTRLDSASSYDPLPRSAWSVLLEKALPAAPPEVDPLRLLMDNGLLRTCSEGGLELTPWLRAAFEQEWLRIRVPHDDFPWEIYALDPARRAMLDRALDEQSPSKLIERATWALACDARDLRFVAAVEALFAAAARRLDRWQPTKAQLPVLQALGHRQLTLMQSLPAGAGFPQAALTRRNSGDAGRAATAWVGEAWWFSLHVTPPRLDSDPGWLMPGWSGSLDLASAPPNLPLPHPAVSLFDRAARLVVGHVRTAPLGDVHASLRPWVLLDGPGRGWEIPRAIQQQVARLPASAELVVHALASEDAISRQRGAALLWQAFLSDTEQQPLLAWRRVERSTPAVRSFVRENLAVAAFLEPWSSSTSIPEGDSGLELLPPRLMRAALRALLSQQKAGPIPPVPLLAALVESLGDEDLDLLGELGSGGFEHGYVAARKLWDLAPSVATKHAREQLASGDERAQVWFDTAPAMQHEKLLQLLQERRRELPAWCATWIVSALPRAAGVARALYAELRTHQEFAAPEAKLRVPLRGALPRGRSECVHESPPDGGEVAAPAIESARSPRRRSSTGRGVSAGNPRGKS